MVADRRKRENGNGTAMPAVAQFEREMISERTHDKMSAARRKGK